MFWYMSSVHVAQVDSVKANSGACTKAQHDKQLEGPTPQSGLLARAAAFLPQLQAANAALSTSAEQHGGIEVEPVHEHDQGLVLPNGQPMPAPQTTQSALNSGSADSGTTSTSIAASDGCSGDDGSRGHPAVQMDIACGVLDLQSTAAQAAGTRATTGVAGNACAQQERDEDSLWPRPARRVSAANGDVMKARSSQTCARTGGVAGSRGQPSAPDYEVGSSSAHEQDALAALHHAAPRLQSSGTEALHSTRSGTACAMSEQTGQPNASIPTQQHESPADLKLAGSGGGGAHKLIQEL